MSSAELLRGRNLSDANDLANKQANWLRSDLRARGYELAIKEMRGHRPEGAYEGHQDDLYKLYRLEKRS
jgi:hypothetical protein